MARLNPMSRPKAYRVTAPAVMRVTVVKTTTWRPGGPGDPLQLGADLGEELDDVDAVRRARLAGPLARRSRSRCSSRSASLRSSRFISRRSFRSSRGGGTRTPSRWFWRPVLCQLSYAPGCGGARDAREPPGRTGGIVLEAGRRRQAGSFPAGDDSPSRLNPAPANGAAPGRRPGPPEWPPPGRRRSCSAQRPGPPGRGADRRRPARRGRPALRAGARPGQAPSRRRDRPGRACRVAARAASCLAAQAVAAMQRPGPPGALRGAGEPGSTAGPLISPPRAACAAAAGRGAASPWPWSR